MSDPRPPRRYDDDEVARILERATEIRQETRALPRGGGQDGLTLAELEEIAAEAGIDVAHLRQAALEVDQGVPEDGWTVRYLGEVTNVTFEVTVPGELEEDSIPAVLMAIQEVIKDGGHQSYMARTLTWRSDKKDGQNQVTQVTVSARHGETLIRVEEDLRLGAGNYHGGITSGIGFGVGLGAGIPVALALNSLVLGFAIPVAALGGAYAIARAAYRGFVRKRRRVAARLLARLEEVVRVEAGRSLEG